MDETGMLFDPRPPKVAAPKGLKKVRYRSSGQKGQLSDSGGLCKCKWAGYTPFCNL